MKQKIKTFRNRDYLFYSPVRSETNSKLDWPLILFLHGSGEQGNDIQSVLLHGIPNIVEREPYFEFFTISPQCPKNRDWKQEMDYVLALVDKTLENYPINRDQVFLTGLSLGGYGTWYYAVKHPLKFAAIAPVCGGGSSRDGFPNIVKLIKDVPVWAFHGAKDPTVPVSETEILVTYLETHQGRVKKTIYPNLGHDCWTKTYSNPELYKWFLLKK